MDIQQYIAADKELLLNLNGSQSLFWDARIYLGVHYPGDILFGTIEGCFIGYLIYLLYKFIQKKIFYKPRCISNQYTASGYLISDINLFYIILISTYFFIIIVGMIVTHTLNL